MNNYSTHNWNCHWPGNYCLDCGANDSLFEQLETSLIDCTCEKGCRDCFFTRCKVNPEIFNKIDPCPGK